MKNSMPEDREMLQEKLSAEVDKSFFIIQTPVCFFLSSYFFMIIKFMTYSLEDFRLTPVFIIRSVIFTGGPQILDFKLLIKVFYTEYHKY